jgi:hypothetical protein
MNKITKISEDYAASWEDFFDSPLVSEEYWIEIDVPYMAMVGAGDFYLGQISSNISLEEVKLSGSHQYGELYFKGFIANSSTLDGYFDVTTNILATKDATHTLSDRSITSADALDALRMSVGLSPQEGLISNAQYISADFNRDGKVTSSDALQILKYAVGLDVENEAEWVFINSNGNLKSISRSSVEYETIISFDETVVIGSADTTALLIGDVNASYGGLIA